MASTPVYIVKLYINAGTPHPYASLMCKNTFLSDYTEGTEQLKLGGNDYKDLDLTGLADSPRQSIISYIEVLKEGKRSWTAAEEQMLAVRPITVDERKRSWTVQEEQRLVVRPIIIVDVNSCKEWENLYRRIYMS